VPKNHQEYRNISKDIELHRNAAALENTPFAWAFYYFLYLSFFRRFLHTGEVRGSSPLSPTTFFSAAFRQPFQHQFGGPLSARDGL
jgi:hypothetical protein